MAIVELDRKVAAAGDLPPVCVHCGAPAVVYRRRSFSGRTPITVTAGLGFLRAKLPVCERHRYHSWMRYGALAVAITTWATLLFTIGSLDNRPNTPAFLVPLAPWRGALILACVAAMGAIIVIRFAAFYTDIRLYGANWSTIWLTGVSDAFAHACQQRNARSWVDDVTAPHGDAGEVVMLTDASGDAPSSEGVRSHVIPGKRRTAAAAPGTGPPGVETSAGRPAASRPNETSAMGGVTAAPPGRGGLSKLLLVGIIGIALCCGLPSAIWLGVSLFDGTKVRIQTVETQPIGGLGTQLQVSVRGRDVDSQASYVVVVKQGDRVVAERLTNGVELQRSDRIRIDILSGPFGASGSVDVAIYQDSPAGRELVSNVRSVDVN